MTYPPESVIAMRKQKPSDLFDLIPIKEIERVFKGTASAELSYDFLCMDEVYKAVREFVPTSWTILDLGCGYAAQAYYFLDYPKYIAVGLPAMEGMIRFHTDNMELYEMSIQEYIQKYIETLDCRKTFAICSYVPDDNARNLVRECFPNCLVYYP